MRKLNRIVHVVHLFLNNLHGIKIDKFDGSALEGQGL